MPRNMIVPLPVILGFALSLAIVALAHADSVDGSVAETAAPPPPVEQQTQSKYIAEEEPSGWLSGFKSLFSWRVGDVLDAIEVEPATAGDGADRQSR